MAVVGVGLIGGSVAMAARAAGWHVMGVDSADVIAEARALGAVDEAATLDDVSGADVVVLAAPVSQILRIIGGLEAGGAIVTDVGSTKAEIVRAAEARGLRFVGGHPMAGSERGGVTHARADLLRGARHLLTPTEATDPEAYSRIVQLVRDDLGALPVAVPPEKHDRLMAALSHLPHVVAIALLEAAAAVSEDALGFAGPSFRDLTRVGASNPGLWSDILASNAAAVEETLDTFEAALRDLRAELRDPAAIAGRFDTGRRRHERLGRALMAEGGMPVEIAVPVENRRGVLAEVTTLLGADGINILDLYLHHASARSAALVLTVDAADRERAVALLRRAGFRTEEPDAS